MSSPFPTTYWAARDAFRHHAVTINAVREIHPISDAAAEPAGLSIDVASFGSSEPIRSVVISSGLHGIEGFFGSAVQTTFLQRVNIDDLIRRRIQIVLIHAINPYGFAMLRRVNEDNIDLNRNFLLSSDAYAGSSPEYTHLSPFLNPSSMMNSASLYYLSLLWHMLRLGMPKLRQGVGEGQYEFPKGLFFGGKRPSRSNEILRRNILTWVRARQVLHLDLHTGLGTYAKCKLLATTEIGADAAEAYRQLFNMKVERADSAYRTKGNIGQWMQAVLGKGTNYHFLAAEFGTHSSARVLRSLQNENAAHFFMPPSDQRFSHAKAELLECFCPHSSEWRDPALKQGVRLLELAIGF